MRLRTDRRGRLAGFGELALGMAVEIAYIGAFFVVGIVVCLVCLAFHA